MEINKATSADAEWIKKLYAENKNEIGSFNLFYSWEDYLKGKGWFYTIEDKAFVRITYSSQKKMYVVQEIAVAKSARGQGLGAILMNAVPKPVMLKCNQDNTGGNSFYEKIGMTKAGTTATKKGNPQNIWVKLN